MRLRQFRARHSRVGPPRVMVEEDVVPIGAQALVPAEKRPHEVERGLEDGWNLAWPSRSANRGEQSGPELLDLHCCVHSPECTPRFVAGALDCPVIRETALERG